MSTSLRSLSYFSERLGPPKMDRTSLPTSLHVRILYRRVGLIFGAFASNMDDFF